MTSVLVQQELADKLKSKDGRVEIRSEDGTLLGHFVPANSADEEMWERARNAFTAEEIERAMNETGGSTWPEIRGELEARWPSM